MRRAIDILLATAITFMVIVVGLSGFGCAGLLAWHLIEAATGSQKAASEGTALILFVSALVGVSITRPFKKR